MSIRRAQSKDIPDVLRLLEQVNLVHHLGRPDLFKRHTKYTADELEEIFRDDQRPVFVYDDPDESHVPGYAFCIFQQVKNSHLLCDIRTLYIDDICVDENCRRRHIGKQLYDYVLDFARRNGCYNVTLNVWSCNEPAMRFYEKCGMKQQKICMETILGTSTEI